ncbi:MAG: hypothetical protein JWN78_2051 [Bacteroidota bacterium]|nr:hypothetical protein [Bacteroidota bacterium]
MKLKFYHFILLLIFTSTGYSQSYYIQKPQAIEYKGYNRSNFTAVKLVESYKSCDPESNPYCSGRTIEYRSNILEIYSKGKMINAYTNINDTNFYHLIEDASTYYPLILDSIYFNDSNIISNVCYFQGTPDSVCTFFYPKTTDSYFDENYTIHMVGYTHGYNYNYPYPDVGAYKEFYFQMKTRLEPDTVYDNPTKMVRVPYQLSYKILNQVDPNALSFDLPLSVIPTKDHQNILLFNRDTLIDSIHIKALHIVKIDSNNTITPIAIYIDDYFSNTNIFNHFETNDKIFIYGGPLIEMDSYGNIIPDSLISGDYLEEIQNYKDIQKGYRFYPTSGNYNYLTDSVITLYHLDSVGSTIDSVKFQKPAPWIYYNVQKTTDGKYVILNFEYSNEYGYSDLRITLFDSSGRQVKTEIIKEKAEIMGSYVYANYPIEFIKIDSFNNLMGIYNYTDRDCGPCFEHSEYKTICFNLNFINQVNGQMKADSIPIAGIQVELILNGHSYFTTTDDSGRYNFAPFDTGHGVIILHLDGQPYSSTSTDTIPVILSDTVANPAVNFLLRTTLTSVRNNFSKIMTSVYPNPFNTYTTLSFDYDKPTTLSIISVEGKILQTHSSTQKSYLIYKKELSGGMYLYELRDKETNKLLSTGKLIIK